eukprot:gene5708-7103_t
MKYYRNGTLGTRNDTSIVEKVLGFRFIFRMLIILSWFEPRNLRNISETMLLFYRFYEILKPQYLYSGPIIPGLIDIMKENYQEIVDKPLSFCSLGYNCRAVSLDSLKPFNVEHGRETILVMPNKDIPIYLLFKSLKNLKLQN